MVCVLQLSHVEDDLRQCKRERDDAVLKEKALEQKVYDLEVEAETKAHSKDDKIRQVKLMEVWRNILIIHFPLSLNYTLYTCVHGDFLLPFKVSDFSCCINWLSLSLQSVYASPSISSLFVLQS